MLKTSSSHFPLRPVGSRAIFSRLHGGRTVVLKTSAALSPPRWPSRTASAPSGTPAHVKRCLRSLREPTLIHSTSAPCAPEHPGRGGLGRGQGERDGRENETEWGGEAPARFACRRCESRPRPRGSRRCRPVLAPAAPCPLQLQRHMCRCSRHMPRPLSWPSRSWWCSKSTNLCSVVGTSVPSGVLYGARRHLLDVLLLGEEECVTYTRAVEPLKLTRSC